MGLELNDYGMQQKRIAHMRFLGELYNYEHIDSSAIFQTLYSILGSGHMMSEVSVLYFVAYILLLHGYFTLCYGLMEPLLYIYSLFLSSRLLL